MWLPFLGDETLREFEEFKTDEKLMHSLDDNPIEILSQLRNSFPTPVTLINTRDCFVNDLYIKETLVNLGNGRERVLKKEFFFTPETVPENYR